MVGGWVKRDGSRFRNRGGRASSAQDYLLSIAGDRAAAGEGSYRPRGGFYRNSAGEGQARRGEQQDDGVAVSLSSLIGDGGSTGNTVSSTAPSTAATPAGSSAAPAATSSSSDGSMVSNTAATAYLYAPGGTRRETEAKPPSESDNSRATKFWNQSDSDMIQSALHDTQYKPNRARHFSNGDRVAGSIFGL